MNVDYVQHWGDDLIVANAARVSFDKHSEWEELEVMTLIGPPDVTDDLRGWQYSGEVRDGHEMGLDVYRRLSEKDEKLVNYLAKHKHTSCFEHMGATLKLKVPIFIARQIQRHRTFSYNEISRRYVDNEPEFFWPDKWRKRAENAKQGSSDDAHSMEILYGTDGKNGSTDLLAWVEEHVSDTLLLYNTLVKEGVAPEQARMILPQNMYTEFYMSGNLRAWEHFLKLRLDGHAQIEVQTVAKMVEEILQPLFPVSMKALMEN